MDFFKFAENTKKYTVSNLKIDLENQLEKSNDAKDLQLQQWDEGYDLNGKILGVYSKATEIITEGQKQAGETYDLLDTGNFRENTFLVSNNFKFNFDSKGRNTFDLLQKIGSRIFGLQNKNLDKFTKIAQNETISLLNKNLKLK